MNSSSLSDAVIAGAVAGATAIAALLAGSLGWIGAAGLGAAAAFVTLAIGFAGLRLHRHHGSILLMTRACRRAADGDLEARIVGLRDRGALRDLANALNRVLDVGDAFLREATAAMEHARDRRFYRKLIERGLPGAFRVGARAVNAATSAMAAKIEENQRLAVAFEQSLQGTIRTVASAAQDMRATAASVSSTAAASGERVSSVAAAAGSAATNVQAVAAATEELSTSVREISRLMTRSNEIASQAVVEAERSSTSIEALNDAAQKISEAVKLVSEIAAQTNLLALNATIEAARAGEAGKGFAVVAGEVKALANQTAQATTTIASQVAAIRSATDGTVAAIGGIARTIALMREMSTATATAVEQQGAATREIAQNVQEAANGTAEVSTNLSAFEAAAQETGQSTRRVLDASEALSSSATRLDHEVEAFFTRARAG